MFLCTIIEALPMNGLSNCEKALESDAKSTDATRMAPMSVVANPTSAVAVGNHEVVAEKPFWTRNNPSNVKKRPAMGNKNLSFFPVWKLRI
jgi:hypothetical protein